MPRCLNRPHGHDPAATPAPGSDSPALILHCLIPRWGKRPDSERIRPEDAMEFRNPIETLIGANGTAKVAGLSLLDLDSMTRPGTAAARAHCGAGPQSQGRVRPGPPTPRSRSLPSALRTLRSSALRRRPTATCGRKLRQRVPGTLRRADDEQPEQAHPSSPGVHGQPDFASIVHPREVLQAGHPGERRLGHFLHMHNHPSGDPSAFSRGRGDHPPAPPGGRGDGEYGSTTTSSADTTVSSASDREGLL